MNFLLNLKNRRTPALLALALLTTNAWTMRDSKEAAPDRKEAASNEVVAERQRQRNLRAEEERAYAQRMAAAAQMRRDAEIAGQLQDALDAAPSTYSSSSSSSSTPKAISSSSSISTVPTQSSGMATTGLDVDDNGSGSLDVDEKSTITPVATVTLTAVDKASRQVPLNRFSVSALYETAKGFKDGIAGWIEDMQKQTPLNFPSATTLNAFCDALETIYQAQQKALNKNTQYYPRATVEALTVLLQKLSQSDGTFIHKLADYLTIPELAVATAPECQVCSERVVNTNPRNIDLSCGHTICTNCLVKTFVQRGAFVVTEAMGVHEFYYRPNKYYHLCPSCRAEFNEATITQLTELARTIYTSRHNLRKELMEQIAVELEAHRDQPYRVNLLISALQNTNCSLSTSLTHNLDAANTLAQAMYGDGELRPTPKNQQPHTSAAMISAMLSDDNNKEEHQGIKALDRSLPNSWDGRPDTAMVDDLVASLYLPCVNEHDRKALQIFEKLCAADTSRCDFRGAVDQKTLLERLVTLLWEAYSKHPARDGIFTRLPESDLKKGLVQKMFDSVYQQMATDPQFDFIEWYLNLPTDNREINMGIPLLDYLKTKVDSFLNPYFPALNRQPSEQELTMLFAQLCTQFNLLPESLFKVLIRHGYWQKNQINVHTISHEAKFLDNLPIDTIMLNCFAASSKSDFVRLSGYNLASLNGFDALLIFLNDQYPIKHLYLCKNRLCSINPKVIHALTQLEDISLAENQFTSLPDDIFSNCPNLRVIDLAKNNLTTVTARLFAGLRNLVKINLSENKLASISAHAFDTCPKLSELYLGHNVLHELDPQLLHNCPELSEVNFSHNELEAVSELLFARNPELDTIDLRDNKIAQLPAALVHHCPDLEYFSFDYNLLARLPNDLFSYCPKITKEHATCCILHGARSRPRTLLRTRWKFNDE